VRTASVILILLPKIVAYHFLLDPRVTRHWKKGEKETKISTDVYRWILFLVFENLCMWLDWNRIQCYSVKLCIAHELQYSEVTT
jgi:hypothetical protein